MTTYEEALEQGWHELPTSPFFTEDQRTFFRKCHQSPWVVMRRTVPKAVLAPWLVERAQLGTHAEKEVAMLERAFAAGVALPFFVPEPRPITFSYFPEYRR